MNESPIQAAVRIAASQRGLRLWRNNVGVAYDNRNVPVRFGLANDSAQMNREVKSSDLIGITPHIVVPQDIGRILGVFTSFECKRGGWVYKGTERERAQLAWLELVQSLGGIAKFITGVEDI